MIPQPSILPPVMQTVLSQFMGMQDVVKNATLHYPTVGRMRGYQSLGDALSYEAGFLAFDPGDAPPQYRTPFADGWHDAAAHWDAQLQADLDGTDREDDDGVAA